MCYSFKTSVSAYVVAMLSGFAALYLKQYAMSILVFAYAQMQLAEALIWYGIDTNNTSINKLGTSYGKYLLATHNIAIGIGILLYAMNTNKRITFYDTIPLIIGAIFFMSILYIYNTFTYPNTTHPHLAEKSCDNCDSENRLLWPWPHSWYIISYVISIIISLIWIKPLATSVSMILLLSLTFIFSYIIYPNTMGSVWCFTASAIAPLIVMMGGRHAPKTPSHTRTNMG